MRIMTPRGKVLNPDLRACWFPFDRNLREGFAVHVIGGRGKDTESVHSSEFLPFIFLPFLILNTHDKIFVAGYFNGSVFHGTRKLNGERAVISQQCQDNTSTTSNFQLLIWNFKVVIMITATLFYGKCYIRHSLGFRHKVVIKITLSL